MAPALRTNRSGWGICSCPIKDQRCIVAAGVIAPVLHFAMTPLAPATATATAKRRVAAAARSSRFDNYMLPAKPCGRCCGADGSVDLRPTVLYRTTYRCFGSRRLPTGRPPALARAAPVGEWLSLLASMHEDRAHVSRCVCFCACVASALLPGRPRVARVKSESTGRATVLVLDRKANERKV